MSGSRNGSARFFRRGRKKLSMAGGSLNPRLSRHCASSGEIFSCAASWPASSGCGGASDQRNFIGAAFFSRRAATTDSARERHKIAGDDEQ